MTEDKQKLEIDWLRTAGGALAAMSSAVLLSTLGAAGTIIGAALGSVVITVGGAIYTQGLAESRRRLAEAQTAALRKVGVAQAEVRRATRTDSETAADAHLAHADERLDDAKEDLDAVAAEPEPTPWGQRLARLPWKRLLLVAGGLFVTTVVAITVFELVAGRSVSQITGGTSDGGGGTTVGQVGGGGPVQAPKQDDQAPTDAPTGEPSDTASPSESPTPEQSASSSPTPTEAPTPTVIPTPYSSEPAPTPTG